MDINLVELGASVLRVLIVGLVLGAGLPAIFAIGMRLQAIGAGDMTVAEGSDERTGGRGNPAATGAAYLMYAIVIAAVIAGVLFVTRHSLGHYFGLELFGGL